MLIHVQNDPTLHGSVVSITAAKNHSYQLPAKLSYAGNMVSLKSANRIEADSRVVSTSSRSAGTYNLLMSRELQTNLNLPNKTILHCTPVEDTWKIGPCLAVYVRSSSNQKARFGPQTRLLKDLTVLAAEMGVDLVVIGPGFLKNHKGYRYDSEKEIWNEVQIGFPDIVLRRSGGFDRLQGGLVKTDMQAFSKAGILHTLPRSYTNKWTMHRLLSEDAYLKPYLLDTYLAANADDVFNLTQKHLDVYVKPLTGAQGHQVYHLQSLNHVLQIEWQRSNEKLTKDGLLQRQVCYSEQDFGAFWKSTGLKKCIVQETFHLPRVRGETPFDLRWLVQFTDGPAVTARMARVGQPHSVTTNLHTGGKPVKAADLMEKLKWKNVGDLIDELDTVAIHVAETCRRKFGPIAELGVDLAVNESRELKIFEINSTPGRRMLKLATPELRRLSLHNLLEYAINATGFTGES